LKTYIQAGIPGAKRVIVYDSGHLIPFEQPGVFNDLVLKFLLSNDPK